MAIRLTEKSPALVELPMLLFLRLADADGKMTAREMERFDALIEKRQWCRSPLLREALANTRAEKPGLWKQYASGALRASIDRAAADFDTVLGTAPPDERESLERDFLHFCNEIRKAGRAPAGFSADPAETREFASLRELITLPSARAAARATVRPDSAAQPQPASRPAAGLLIEAGADTVWRRGKLPLRCVHVVDETRNVKTFHFVAEPPKLFSYRPGQFLTFELPIDGKIVRRSYSISASPSRPYSLSVTVKRVESGLASNWLHDNLKVGVTLFADGPNGKFTCLGEEGGPYLFISGGSGVTPVMAMSRWLHDTAPDVDVCFLHYAQGPKDFIFERELRLMERHRPAFRCIFVCTSDAEGWDGPKGRISAESLSVLVPDAMTRWIYLCGPVPFMATAREILERNGFDMSRFRQESFGGAPQQRPAKAGAAAPAKVTFSASKMTVDCETTDTLLDVALKQGVDVSFSCRAGQCGSCKTTLLKGAVEQDCTDCLADDELKGGIILLCQAHPQGDIVVDH
ncbi:MAG: hybrid-cluster NAD(P)-dependent oxidoreductase [Hyphomicrobiales bacterium]|nr:hybrid-cluster NAD(P)-dependent oxidoreductase [Hyphomicrobiales bacterium]